MATTLRNIRLTLEMIKIEHTLFALPFAFLGAVLASRGLPTLSQVFWISMAMVGARSTAMAGTGHLIANRVKALGQMPMSYRTFGQQSVAH